VVDVVDVRRRENCEQSRDVSRSALIVVTALTRERELALDVRASSASSTTMIHELIWGSSLRCALRLSS